MIGSAAGDGSSAFHSAVYGGRLAHARSGPVRYAFAHRVCFYLFDLAELPSLSHRLRLFGYNRPALLSLYDRDYGDGSGAPLEAELRRWLAARDVDLPRGRILLLTQARVLGYVFNPVSFFYCLDESGAPRCIVAEVNNTFGDRHRYLLDERSRDGDGTHHADKLLHVSPFFSLECAYRFVFSSERPDETARAPLSVRMDVAERGQPRFTAHLSGRRRALDDRALAWSLLAHPLMTLRTIGLIHYHALRLFFRGAPFHHQPPYDPQAARRNHAREDARRLAEELGVSHGGAAGAPARQATVAHALERGRAHRPPARR